jgi:hypothetical protein
MDTIMGTGWPSGKKYNRRLATSAQRWPDVNYAMYEAIAAVAVGPAVLGDKGALEDTAHLNSTHVVDVAEIGGDDDDMMMTQEDRRGLTV